MLGNPPLEYHVRAARITAHGSVARCKSAQITLDTDVSGRVDAFNPAELLLASIAACMIKGIERVTPLLNFRLDGVEVRLAAKRQDSPPRLIDITYELIVDTQESDHRLALLHQNVRKFGTVTNTIAAGTPIFGGVSRAVRTETDEHLVVDADRFRRIDDPVDPHQLSPLTRGHNEQPG